MSRGGARSRKRPGGFALIMENSCLSGSDPVAAVDSIALRRNNALSGLILQRLAVIKILSAIFVVLVGAVLVRNFVRGDEYSSTTLYVSERNVVNVMDCISSKSSQIKSGLEPISICRWGSSARTSCQIGGTYLSVDGQMRLTVQPSNGTVEIRIRHNQPLSSSAIATLERCAQ